MDEKSRLNPQDLLSARVSLLEFTNLSVDAVVVIDSEQHILLFNPTAEVLFGYSRAEVIGKPVELLVPRPQAFTHR